MLELNRESKMILSRRAFSVSSLALVLAGAFEKSAVALDSADLSAHALNRLTFGSNASSTEEFSKLGLEAWLDRELAKPATNEDLQRRLSAATLMIEYDAGKDDKNRTWKARKESVPYQYLDATGAALLPLLDFEKNVVQYEERIRPAREVQAAALIRAVHADAQLREVITQFWHDHFNVNSMKDEHAAAYFPIHDRILRENAFGNFRKLLGEVTRSPSMLFYLNNEASRASPANENFARELFELHTLGAMHYYNDKTTDWSAVPGAKQGKAEGYIDQDVYEAARALTGWSFGDGRWVAEGDNAPSTGEFHYIDRWHDPYQKRILGIEFRANAGPMMDGEKLLDILAHHPGTAQFLCTKICRRLLADEPPTALVDYAAKIWLKNVEAPDQIAKVLKAIALSPEFTETPPQRLKRPFEFLASFYRRTNAEVRSPSLQYHWALQKAGWMQHEFRPPTGHPDHNEYWANTNLISGYVNLALNAFEDWGEAGKVSLASQVPSDVTRLSDATVHAIKMFQGSVKPQDVERAVADLTNNPEELLPENPQEREGVLRGLVAMASLSPQFLFR
jgi:uncharacterized protein (DUF1800 family)